MDIKSSLLPVLLIWCLCGTLGSGTDDVIKNVEVLLDGWKDRMIARQRLFQIGPESQAALQSVALANNQSPLRRRRAISLLGTLGNAESIKTLADICNIDPPSYRCYAMHAMSEIGTEDTLPIFIRKLDDRTICLKRTYTDPAEEEDILVCDEAIRLLERITGQSLAAEKDRDEKIRMWKTWWSNRSNAKKNN
jgi:hypothetical protein